MEKASAEGMGRTAPRDPRPQRGTMNDANDQCPRRTRLRVVNPVSTTSNPADVTAIGSAELEFCLTRGNFRVGRWEG